jgi:hypothetical protein
VALGGLLLAELHTQTFESALFRELLYSQQALGSSFGKVFWGWKGSSVRLSTGFLQGPLLEVVICFMLFIRPAASFFPLASEHAFGRLVTSSASLLENQEDPGFQACNWSLKDREWRAFSALVLSKGICNCTIAGLLALWLEEVGVMELRVI